MKVLDHLFSLIDNGGRRTYLKRRYLDSEGR
jgi:hypothetical protein